MKNEIFLENKRFTFYERVMNAFKNVDYSYNSRRTMNDVTLVLKFFDALCKNRNDKL